MGIRLFHIFIISILISIFFFSFLLTCSKNYDENALFMESSKIDLYEPEDNTDLHEAYPVFRWNVEQTEDYNQLIIAISKKPLFIDEKTNTISNFFDIIWIWTPRYEGNYGEVDFANGKKIIFEDNKYKFTGGSGFLTPKQTYYWYIWIFDEFGNVVRSSSGYRFTF